MDNFYLKDKFSSSKNDNSLEEKSLKTDISYTQETCVQDRDKQQIVGSLSTFQDMDSLENSIRELIEQTISKQIQITQLEEKINKFEENVIKYQKFFYDGLTILDRNTNKRSYATNTILNKQYELTEKLCLITDELDNVKQSMKVQSGLIEEQSRVIEEQNEIIRKQHEKICQYEDDVIYKSRIDLVLQLICIADQIRLTLNDYAFKNDKDFNSLYNSIGTLENWVNNGLNLVAVRKYENSNTKVFDPKKQEIVECQKTNKLEDDGMIISKLPGYLWSIPKVGSNELFNENEKFKSFEFVIRHEQVIKLEYEEDTGEKEQFDYVETENRDQGDTFQRDSDILDEQNQRPHINNENNSLNMVH